ncbi:MAG: hypothetical protein Q7S44_00180 [bacterium]|nr:hypothetical protein [bacterium]
MLLVISLLGLSFLQSTLTSWDLVLVVLICRSFIVGDRQNLWLAFSFGILVSYLLGLPLGILSLVYLLAVVLVEMVRKTQVSSQFLVVVPLSFGALLFGQLVRNFGSGIDFLTLILQALLSFPIYLLLLFWEERFIPKKDIKLKIGR